MPNAKDLLTSIIRTLVPATVGLVLTWLASHNIAIDETFTTNLRLFLELLFTGGYYIVIRTFEHYLSPKFGWLLGWAKAPNYVDDVPVTAMLNPDPATAK